VAQDKGAQQDIVNVTYPTCYFTTWYF